VAALFLLDFPTSTFAITGLLLRIRAEYSESSGLNLM